MSLFATHVDESGHVQAPIDFVPFACPEAENPYFSYEGVRITPLFRLTSVSDRRILQTRVVQRVKESSGGMLKRYKEKRVSRNV